MKSPVMHNNPIIFHENGQQYEEEPVLLMLHGFLGRGEDWQETVSSIKSPTRCCFPDLPGHGASLYPDISMEEVADTLAKHIHTQKNKKCILMGYSMGGRIALYTACRYPEYFSGLILVSTTAGLKTERERNDRNIHDNALADTLKGMGDNKEGFEDFLRQWYRQSVFSSLSSRQDLYESLVQRRLQNNPTALSTALRNLNAARQPNLWEELHAINIPVLLIVGKEDKKYCRLGEEMVSLFPQVRLEIIEECGHIPHLEQPERFTDILNRFLMQKLPHGQ